MKRFGLLILIRIQEALRCTRREALVLISILCLYGVGTLIRAARSTVIPYDLALLASGDSLFQALSAAELEPLGVPLTDLIADTLEIPPDFPLDLNGASAADLEHLPGIGPALAGRIIAWRTENGPFEAVDQLTDVSGIGVKTLEKLRAMVNIRTDTTTAAEAGSPGGT
ncbi:MAG: ComEA family DNA-binding protein [Rhodothermales bacterium]|nr:ComEA family DNA-binding protein [Rhodothermales bacterium]